MTSLMNSYRVLFENSFELIILMELYPFWNSFDSTRYSIATYVLPLSMQTYD